MQELVFLKQSFEIDRARFEWLAVDDATAEALADQVFAAVRQAASARSKVIKSENEAWREGNQATYVDLKSQITASTQMARTALSERASKVDSERQLGASAIARIEFDAPGVGETIVRLGLATRNFTDAPSTIVFDDLPPEPSRLYLRWKVGEVWREAEDVLDLVPGKVTTHKITLKAA